RGRTGTFVGMDAHVREVVAQPRFYVASHVGWYRPALASEHLVHDRRRGRRSRSGRVAVELVVVVVTSFSVGFGSQRRGGSRGVLIGVNTDVSQIRAWP